MWLKYFSLTAGLFLSACGMHIVMHPAEINPVEENLDRVHGLLDSVDLSKIEINKSKQSQKLEKPLKVEEPQKELNKLEKIEDSAEKSALWLAALDALRIMPLLQVSRKEGVIVTEWLPNPQDASQEIKIQLFVKEAENDLDVMLFKRKEGKQQLATETSAALKDKILEQAGIVKKEVKEVISK